MPIDQPEATATVNPRRAFLARAAVGGALVTAGSIAGPLLGSGAAGAQDDAGAGDTLDDEAFATIAVPLELAAVQVYEAATGVEGLADDELETLRLFQSHHQAVADTLSGWYEGDEPLVEDPAVLARADAVAGDRTAAMTGLAELEEALAATHLDALASIKDVITAKTVAGVLAVEGQHAVALTILAGSDLAAAVPATVTTDGSLVGGSSAPAGDPAAATTTTTTGEAAN